MSGSSDSRGSLRRLTPERYEHINRIADRALELAPDERARFLDAACAGDAGLLRQVSRMLEAESGDESFLGTRADPDTPPAAAPDSADIVGSVQGHFRIDGRIGAGGMGEVYRAEDTRLNRTVALKLLPDRHTLDPGARRRLLREARTASSISHSGIVTIHSIEQLDGRDAIVMEYVEGCTLRDLIDQGPVPFDRVCEIGAEVADALAAAHAHGLVHRDIKPSNILITTEGHAKVVDFGLAKRIAAPDRPDDPASHLTEAGVVLGTAPYMSPEQARGDPLDGRSDVFSLGTVLFELATRCRPFQGPGVLGILVEIATSTPPPPSSIVDALPPEFDQVIEKALAKDPADRFASAGELRDGLRAIGRNAPAEAPATVPPKRSRSWIVAASIAVAAIVAAGALWIVWRDGARARARAEIVAAADLLKAGRYFESFGLVESASRWIPDDPQLERLRPIVTDTLTLTTDPPGARAFLVRYDPTHPDDTTKRLSIGTTPVENLHIARSDYILEIEKEGYASVRRTISSSLGRVERSALGPANIRREFSAGETDQEPPRWMLDADAPIVVALALTPVDKVPDRMVDVPGGEYALVGHGRTSREAVPLDAFQIDRFEVTNAEFLEFIQAGGYSDRRYWRFPIVLEGRTLSWDEAQALFRDRTGLPGPRSWSNQQVPAERANHPVTDVTWYEAAAYAEFRGKRLPTIYEWEKAARNGAFTHGNGFVMPWGLASGVDAGMRANFLGSGAMPVDSLPFGMSAFGCYHMAGNVAEWCANPRGGGYVTAGGSWRDPAYTLAAYGGLPGLKSSDAIGFRCVRSVAPTGGDQGGSKLDDDSAVAPLRRIPETEIAVMLRQFHYDPVPLDVRTDAVEETESWRRETVSFVGAAGIRVVAYLYLPRNAAPPYHVVHFLPTDAAYYGFNLRDEMEIVAGPYVKAGRAVFGVVLEGYRERPFASPDQPSMNTVAFREQVVRWATDLGRGVDVLTSRPDIDTSRIGCMALSVNPRKLTLVAIEPRYRSIVLVGAGRLHGWEQMIPETNGINYAPYIRAPKLMIHGRYDDAVPLATEGQPLYDLLREPRRLVVVDDGHIPSLELMVPLVNRWWDETMGPVAR